MAHSAMTNERPTGRHLDSPVQFAPNGKMALENSRPDGPRSERIGCSSEKLSPGIHDYRDCKVCPRQTRELAEHRLMGRANRPSKSGDEFGPAQWLARAAQKIPRRAALT